MSLKIANDTANGSSILQPSNTATGDVTHTLPAFPTELAPRMQLMTAQNSTSGTSIDFTGIPSWAKKITVMFNGVSTNGTSPILIKIGSGIIADTGYSGSVVGGSSGITAVSETSGLRLEVSPASSWVRSAVCTIYQVNANAYNFTGSLNDVSGVFAVSNSSKTLSGILDRLRITTVNGTDTFDAGQINVLYEG